MVVVRCCVWVACRRRVLFFACRVSLLACLVVVGCVGLFVYTCCRVWLFVVVLCVGDAVFFVVCLLFGCCCVFMCVVVVCVCNCRSVLLLVGAVRCLYLLCYWLDVLLFVGVISWCVVVVLCL